MSNKQISLGMFAQAFVNVVAEKSFSHLWYLYVLIGIYLILPFLKGATDSMDGNSTKIFLIVLFLINFCIPLVEKLTDVETAFMVPLTTFSVFYVVCGHYIDEYVHLDRKKSVLGFVSILIVIGIVAFVSNSGDYLDYDSPIIGIAAMFVFAVFKGILGKEENESPKFMDKLWKVDRLCFGVYLIHPVFIHFVYRFLKVSPISFGWYWLMMPLFGVGFVVCAFIGSWIMSLIKPLKNMCL